MPSYGPSRHLSPPVGNGVAKLTVLLPFVEVGTKGRPPEFFALMLRFWLPVRIRVKNTIPFGAVAERSLNQERVFAGR